LPFHIIHKQISYHSKSLENMTEAIKSLCSNFYLSSWILCCRTYGSL